MRSFDVTTALLLVTLAGACSQGAIVGNDAGDGSIDQRRDATVDQADPCDVPELCNGVDDDCNVNADEGCPTSLSLGSATSCGCAYGGSGGDAFSRPCGASQALIGFDGVADRSVTQLGPVCGSITFVAVPGAPESSFEAHVVGSSTLADVGEGQTGDEFSERCPANQVAIGIYGTQGDITGRNYEVESIGFICGTITILRQSPGGPWTVTVTRTTNAASHGGSARTSFEYVCPVGSVVTSVTGRGNERLDQVAVSCAPVSLTTL